MNKVFILFKIFRVSSDFKYQKNVVLGNHLRTKKSEPPWHAQVRDHLELEMFIDRNEMTHYSEAFAIHPTDELPMMLINEDIFEFFGGNHIKVLITPTVIMSDKSLKALKPSERLCYFEGERKLQFFKVYTKHNCKIECFSKFMLNVCDCVPFDIVRDHDTEVCGIADYSCYTLTKTNFLDNGLTMMQAESPILSSGRQSSCSCWPPCDTISYGIEIRESKLREDE